MSLCRQAPSGWAAGRGGGSAGDGHRGPEPLSPRVCDRSLNGARTIADLAAHDALAPEHVAAAIHEFFPPGTPPLAAGRKAGPVPGGPPAPESRAACGAVVYSPARSLEKGSEPREPGAAVGVPALDKALRRLGRDRIRDIPGSTSREVSVSTRDEGKLQVEWQERIALDFLLHFNWATRRQLEFRGNGWGDARDIMCVDRVNNSTVWSEIATAYYDRRHAEVVWTERRRKEGKEYCLQLPDWNQHVHDPSPAAHQNVRVLEHAASVIEEKSRKSMSWKKGSDGLLLVVHTHTALAARLGPSPNDGVAREFSFAAGPSV